MALQTGQEIPFKSLPAITAEQLRAYASASGDPNPIHLDEAVARKMGLPGIIAHGMLSAAFLADRALEFQREQGVGLALKTLQTRFKAMTLLGDVISVGGRVKLAEPGHMVLELEARNQRDEVSTTARVEFA